MAPRDEPESLREDILRRWKDELFSADTVVALVAVLVALPAGVIAAVLIDPLAVYPVWFATAVGPSLGYWRGRRIEVGWRTAVDAGAVMALAVAVVTTVVFAAATALEAGPTLSVGVGGIVGLLFGGLLSRYAFHFLDR